MIVTLCSSEYVYTKLNSSFNKQVTHSGDLQEQEILAVS